ncbi:MAG: GNAT family N-acetyltransferase [Verrucomicrobiales bacterium]
MSEFSRYDTDSPERRRLPTPDDLVIRPAVHEDIGEIAEIAAAREGQPAGQWRSAIGRVYEMSADGRAQLVIACVEESVVGYGKTGHFSVPIGSPSNVAPEGWYLTGLVVRPAFRRRGLGSRLTLERLAWIARRSNTAYYFANERNKVSIELHRALGFVKLTHDFSHPHASFEGGAGILFIRNLKDQTDRPRR